MALPYRYTGTLSRGAGLFAALAKNAKILNLKPAQRLNFTFDPFGDNVLSIRKSLHYFYQDKIRETNPKCTLKTTIVCNRVPPSIEVKLDNGSTIVFKTSNLTELEILKSFNKLVTSLVVEDPEPTSSLGKPTKKKK